MISEKVGLAAGSALQHASINLRLHVNRISFQMHNENFVLFWGFLGFLLGGDEGNTWHGVNGHISVRLEVSLT